MLTVFDGATGYPIANDDYYVRELASGLDEVIFNVSIRDPVYKYIVEEARIRERDNNYYLIKQIDAGANEAKIVAQIDVDDWKSAMYKNYTNGSATVHATVQSVLPTGWSIVDYANKNTRRTIPTSDTTTAYNVTAWEVLKSACDIYSVRFRFNNVLKTVYIIDPSNYSNLGAFATRDLNLQELNFKGKSTSFYTRMYAEGADGLTFASINDGKAYIDNNEYSNKIISYYWKDERYTDKQSLLDDATTKLAELAKPTRSYDCDVLDLANTNPEMYGFEDFSLFQVITLIDDAQERRLDYQIVERWDYPYYPVKNKVVLSTSTPKIQNQVVSLINSVDNPTSTFQQIMQSAIANSTALITGNKGGYVVFHDSDNDGFPDEILIMNTPSIETATKVWRWNASGLGYSKNGYNGDYGLAMTIDGSIVASFITTGTLTANLIKAGILTDLNGKFSLNMETGALNMQDGTFKGTIQASAISGGTISGTEISGGTITGTTIRTATSGARIELGKDSNNNPLLIAYNSQGNVLFQADSNGVTVNSGTISGAAISGGTITGSTIKTADNGARIELGKDSNNNPLLIAYNAQGNVLFQANANGVTVNSGTISGSAISGGTITGSTIKTANSGARIELGTDSNYSPQLIAYNSLGNVLFQANDSGVTVNSGTISGTAISGGTITGTTIKTADSGARIELGKDSNNNPLLVAYDSIGNVLFQANASGVTVNSGAITGGTISGSEITGATIKTATSGARIELGKDSNDDPQLIAYNSLGNVMFQANANGVTVNSGTISGTAINGGTVTGTTIQNATEGSRLVIDSSSSVKGYYGDTLHNIINVSNRDGVNNNLIIDADNALHIRTPRVYVSNDSAGTGSTEVYETYNNYGDDSDDGYAFVSKVEKKMPGNEVYLHTLSDTDPDADLLVTLPVKLEVEYTRFQIRHGMLMSGNSTWSDDVG